MDNKRIMSKKQPCYSEYSFSIAMASYNGEKFIVSQINSILKDLSGKDEIVISDDGSTDNTIYLINQIIKKDSRVRLIYGPKKGIPRNFMNALVHCKKDIICLADQDDIWISGKRKKINKIFIEKNCDLITHDMLFIDENGVKICLDLERERRNGFIYNLLWSNYWGCCMALKREKLGEVLPFPKILNAHDQFIGLIFELNKSAFFLDDCLIYHRIHKTNKTSKLTIIGKIKFRVRLFFSVMIRWLLIKD